MPEASILDDFHPIVREWFLQTYGRPSPPQELGWPSIASGANTLILAPTGSGKTLTAFLWAINHLIEQHLHESLDPGIRILYISPLKALNNDIRRNLEAPLAGIEAGAKRMGINIPPIRTAVRTGDTSTAARASMLRHPPDILITTPESLYLMLTSPKARKLFLPVQYVIVDEIHALCGNKRGVHLSLSLERLQELAPQEFVRIGLSATQRPLDKVAAFLGGYDARNTGVEPRPVNIIDAGHKKEMDLSVVCAVEDFTLLPSEGAWPLILGEVLALIRAHKSTLVFVNNRRLAERVAAKLNEQIAGAASSTINLMAVPEDTGWSAGEPKPPEPRAPDEPLVLAYHGSMSRESRETMENDLKAGRIRALVATSSLELGIDIGSIDLVIQLQSPKGVSRGLQRIGRSGHLISGTSKGRIYPTHREDLVESVAVSGAMHHHDVEATHIPENCLDVLAQQIAAMVGVEDWDLDHLFDVIRRSYCYRTLSRDLFAAVVGMLAGRYEHESLRELRPRISWDKINGIVRALPGTSHIAITSGGTIADRGLFGVYLEDGKTKVGEVDEEFIFESRAGDTFILGTSVWRMVEIAPDRITVAPAPGAPARMPFWRGEGIGRSFELGAMVGEFRRTVAERLDDPSLATWLSKTYPVDSRSVWNIIEYFRRQRDATGVIPGDQDIVIEGFRDEIGDPRIVIHSCFGRRINGLLGLLLVRQAEQRLQASPQMLYNDNGILLRCPDVPQLPLDLFSGITSEEADRVVLEDILDSPVFAGQFRQNAGRSLLMPRVAPGKRTPLWLQRLRAADLLQVARQFDDFPVVIETVREVLHDVLDFPRFKELLRRILTGDLRVHATESEVPSPFAASMLFDFMAVYMYEYDQARPDRLSQYVSVNRELLAEVVDLDTISSLIRPEAVETVERQLQHAADGTKARTSEELMEILLRVGDLTEEEIASRCADDASTMIEALVDSRRASKVAIGGAVHWVAKEEQDLYDHLDHPDHPKVDESVVRILRRYLEHHGPVPVSELARRYNLSQERVHQLTSEWATDRNMVRGRFRPPSMPGSDESQWVFRPNIQRIHRQTLSLLRKEIQPCSLEEYSRFLHRWQHLDGARPLAGIDGLQAVLEMCEGLALPADSWERDILFRRVTDCTPQSIAEASGSGSWVWAGAGQGRMRLFNRGSGAAILNPDIELDPAAGESAHRIFKFLSEFGASFLSDIRSGTGLSLAAVNNGVAELFWAGLITNDTPSEVFRLKRARPEDVEVPLEPVQMLGPRRFTRQSPLVYRARRALRDAPGWVGRWSLLMHPGVMGPRLSAEEVAGFQADLLLRRYGILARELHQREDLLPWQSVATELQKREMRGEVRRGYFVQGLSGMQFGLPGAVDLLRDVRRSPASRSRMYSVNGIDPANPYGPGVPFPFGDGSMQRTPGTSIVFLDGTPQMLVQNYGSRLWIREELTPAAITDALQQLVGLTRLPGELRPVKHIDVEYINGSRAAVDPACGILQKMGFVKGPSQTLRYESYR
jgi:ATP-dependent helicase Lhr and Lhr-like helicase